MKIIEELLKLSLDEQERLIKIFEKRSRIVHRFEGYKYRKEELAQELKELQDDCDHIAVLEKKHWYEDEYGKMLDSGYYEYNCPDCSVRWTIEWPEKL